MIKDFQMKKLTHILLCFLSTFVGNAYGGSKYQSEKYVRKLLLEVENEFIGNQLKKTKPGPEIWYKIPRKFVESSESGKGLLRWMRRSERDTLPMDLAKIAHPKYTFHPWMFCRVKAGLWNEKTTLLNYFEWLGAKYEINSSESWEEVLDSEFLRKNFGAGIMRTFPNNYINIFYELHPHYDYNEWAHKGKTTADFWSEASNRKRYLFWLQEKLKDVSTHKELGRIITAEILYQNKGYGLLEHYNGSIHLLREEEFSRFSEESVTISSDFGIARDAIKKCIESVFGRFTEENVYKVKNSHLRSCLGKPLTDSFIAHGRDSSVARVIEYYFKSEFDLKLWLFERTPKHFFQKSTNRRKFLRWLVEELELNTQDLYNMSYYTVQSYGGEKAMTFAGGLVNLVTESFPEVTFELSSFKSIWKRQSELYSLIEGYTGLNWKFNFKHPRLRFEKSNIKMEFDIFLENVAFEYQGEQHYYPISRFGGEESHRKTIGRDKEKREAAKAAQILLIEIPYNWNGTRGEFERISRDYIQNRLSLSNEDCLDRVKSVNLSMICG